MWDAIVAVHLLGMAFFVGGQLFLGLVVVPVERRAPDRQRLRALARRFGVGTVIALAVLLASGAALASHRHRWSDSTLQVKLGLVALVAVLLVAHVRRPASRALDGAILLVSLAVVYLGVRVAG
jgi:uncharacterized membrane protein